MNYPRLFLLKNEDRRLRQGHAWVFSNEVDANRSPLPQFACGEPVEICDSSGATLGVGYVNPNTLICARLLSRKPNTRLGVSFVKARVEAALRWRERLFDKPFYRLIYGESDGLPGLVVDRFGEVLSVQITTAGMERLKAFVLEALVELLRPRAVWLKNDASQRHLEGLDLTPALAYGTLPEWVELEENGVRFVLDAVGGQKTGWFYDHRASRELFSRWCHGLRVLDLFSYAGAWGVQAAAAGAESVTCVDSSASALELASASAGLNSVRDKMEFVTADAFEYLRAAREQQLRFDAVILDPPALIKRKKDYKAGYEAYRRLNHLALQVLAPHGLLASASCSHHLSRDDLHEILRGSARHIDRHATILASGGQGPDHPVHPAIPETEYLKTFFCAVSGRF